jgi:hypothetical protein
VTLQLTPYGYRPPPPGVVDVRDEDLTPYVPPKPEPGAEADGAGPGAEADGAGPGAEAGGGAGAAGAASSAGVPAAAAATPPAAPPSRNCLRIIAHRAMDLRGQGVLGSSCKASVRIDVGPFTARSKVIDSQAPRWEQGWAFPVLDPGWSINVLVDHSGSLLEGGYTCLGRAVIPLTTLGLDKRPGERVTVTNVPTKLLSADFKDEPGKPRGTVDL